jgi:hypothetical protein
MVNMNSPNRFAIWAITGVDQRLAHVELFFDLLQQIRSVGAGPPLVTLRHGWTAIECMSALHLESVP